MIGSAHAATCARPTIAHRRRRPDRDRDAGGVLVGVEPGTHRGTGAATDGDAADRLAQMGIQEAEPNIRNKLARGKFSAAFLLECLTAIGCSSLRLHSA